MGLVVLLDAAFHVLFVHRLAVREQVAAIEFFVLDWKGAKNSKKRK